MLTMTRTEAIPFESMRQGMPWDWETIPEYLDSLDRAPKGVNVIQYMPTASLMTYVMGLEAAKSRPATEPGAQGDAAPAARGHGGRAGRLLDPAPRPGLRAGRLRRHRRWSPTRWSTRTSSPWPRCWPSATRARSRSPRPRAACRGTTRSSSGSPRSPSARCSTTSSPCRGTRPTCTASRSRWVERCRDKGLPIYAQCATGRAGFAFTLEHWNLYDAVAGVAGGHHRHQGREAREDAGPRAAHGARRRGRGGRPAAAGDPGRRRRRPGPPGRPGRQPPAGPPAVRRAQRRRDRRGRGQAPHRGDARPVARR